MKIIKDLLNKYDLLEIENVANNDMFTEYFLETYPYFRLNNKFQELESGVVIYPKECFERPTFNKKWGYTVHHFAAS